MESSSKELSSSKYSFKVLTECPIIIALLFQLYRNFVTSNVPGFVEPIIKVLNLQPPQQQQAHDEAAKKGQFFLGMAPTITNATVYAEYKSLQVKVSSSLLNIRLSRSLRTF
jgi:transformation/transcription domain-associated protein